MNPKTIIIEIDMDHFLHIQKELPLALLKLSNDIRQTGIIPREVVLPLGENNMVVGTIREGN